MICEIFNINVRKIIYQYRLLREREKKRSIHIFVSKIKIETMLVIPKQENIKNKKLFYYFY